MTEKEWLAGNDYVAMLRFVHARTTICQARLYMAACCRQKIAECFDQRISRILEAAERCADNACSEVVLKAYQWRWLLARKPRLPRTGRWLWLCNAIADAHQHIEECRSAGTWDGTRHHTPEAAIAHALYMSLRDDPLEAYTGGEGDAVYYCARLVDRAGVLRLRETPGQSLFEIDQAKERIRMEIADLLRDIFGNPYRKVKFKESWRTDTVLALAKQMYESRDFSAMPILADALQDAGCDNDDILSHCRDANQVHVRGCWVVDLVLGKQ